ncbi:MAG TPA: type II toxin-antitoxin system HicA family toxin [Actinomycetota bacterium]|jgi:predicted RNA binding protein YcfA (HicA-like mRNA interferase family)|nr:type II toxin-antitoxin system HicA family toxin [Actinomycetota bacterium]
MKVRAVIKLIEADGWRFVRQSGSLRHPTKPGTVTIAGKPGDELRPGTLANIFWQARLKGPGT